MKRITKSELARRLEAQVECAQGGEAGLNILIYGWLKYRKYGNKYYNAVRRRNWLYITEVMDLSEYGGYDLSILRL